MARLDACPTAGCENRKRYTATVCWSCYVAETRRATLMRRTCRDCGGLKHRGSVERCDPCARIARRTSGTGPACACGGRKAPLSKHCQSCDAYVRRHAPVWRGILRTFDAAWFRRMIESADMEWTPRLIEEATRGQLPHSSVSSWLRGERKPTLVQWQQIRRLLALEPCSSCGGLGYVDGAPVELPAAEPAAFPSPARPDARVPIVVGDLSLSVQRGEVTFRGRTVTLSRRETQTLAALMLRADRPVRSPELLFAVFGRDASLSGEHAVRVIIARLRAKLRPIGAEDVISSRGGFGWWIEASDGEEASA